MGVSNMITVAILLLLMVSRARCSCYANEKDKYLYFSTKTSGLEIDNESVQPIVSKGTYLYTRLRRLSNRCPIFLKGCRAKSFWMVARHGTRNPGDEDIIEMNEKGPKIVEKVIKVS